LASGGYIINIKPMAKGIFVVPEEKELIKSFEDGKKFPIPTPTAMAKNIQRVRNLSKKPSFFLSTTGAQLLEDILQVFY
jgi:hypothetical protein